MIPKSWYKYLIRVDFDVVYCDHLACCLLAELLSLSESEHQVYTSLKSLAELVNHLESEIKHSLELLKSLNLIHIHYPLDPEKLLQGAIAITINLSLVQQITTENFSNFSATSSKTTARQGIVYVIQAQNTNQFKIGRTTNFHRRFKQLQSMNNQQLLIFKLINCYDAIATETSLHHKFKHFRRPGSEWFELPSIALDFIRCYSEI